MIDVYTEFMVTYLTETVVMDMNPLAKRQRERIKGMVTYFVWAKNAEDAILRLREQEPQEHPIIEIAGVQPTGKESTALILPREWNVDNSLLRVAEPGGGGGKRSTLM